MQDRKFYVYAHRRKADGSIFYVGKGSGGRAFSDRGRSDEWENCAAGGFSVNIIASGLSERCAYSIEKIAIHLLGAGGLVNKTKGGSGISGFVRSNSFKAARSGRLNPNTDRRIYEFHHMEHGTRVCERIDLCREFSLKTSLLGQVISGKRTHTKGWHMAGATPIFQKGLQHPAIVRALYKFHHNDHGSRVCTRYELSRDFGLSVSNLKAVVDGKQRSTHGWRCIGPADDEELPDAVIKETEKMRRYAA